MATINAAVDGIILTADSSATLSIQVGGSAAISIGTGATTTISNATITSLTISNPSTFPAGSASAPAITTTGDTNTGIYFPAADQVAVTAGGSVAAAFNSNGLFFRNRIINGDMRIDQRNAGASITLSTTTQYPVDRFASYKGTSSATLTAQQSSTAPTGFVNSIIYTVSTGSAPAAGDINAFWHPIEGTNMADFGWGAAGALTVTMSFWVRASLTGTYSVSFQNNGSGGAGDRFYLATYTVNSANTWEYKTITVPGDTSGTWLTTTGKGMQITWDIGYGSNFNGTAGSWGSSTIRRTSGSVQLVANTGATLYITGIQLETGSVATPFERRPYGTELMLCQRYCVLIASGVNKPICNANYYSATNALGYIPFPVDMRTTPTLSATTGTNYYIMIANGGNDGLNSLTQDIRNERGMVVYNNTEASGTAGHGGVFACADAAAKVLATAEL